MYICNELASISDVEIYESVSHVTIDVKNNVSYSTTASAIPSTVTGLPLTTGTGDSDAEEYDDIVSTAHLRRPSIMDTQRLDEVAGNTDEYEEYEEYVSHMLS